MDNNIQKEIQERREHAEALKEDRPQAVRAAQERKCQFFGRRANH